MLVGNAEALPTKAPFMQRQAARLWLPAMCSHASAVCRQLSGLPCAGAPLCSRGVALPHRCSSRGVGAAAGGVQVQLPRGWCGLLMAGGGKCRRRDEGRQSQSRKKLLHIASPLDEFHPGSGFERIATLCCAATVVEMRTPTAFDYGLEEIQPVHGQ